MPASSAAPTTRLRPKGAPPMPSTVPISQEAPPSRVTAKPGAQPPAPATPSRKYAHVRKTLPVARFQKPPPPQPVPSWRRSWFVGGSMGAVGIQVRP